MRSFEEAIRNLLLLFRKPDPDGEPTPRWQTLVLSFFIGMLMYFMALRFGMHG